jgi:poly(A) polymerase
MPPPLPTPSRDDAKHVVEQLRAAGHVAYFAGGCVRDELLGLAAKDYDVATNAPPEAVRSLFRNTQAVGAAFGVVLVRINRSQVEVATFRTDGRYDDGRRPIEVQFASERDDAQRRDFTINGMFLDPLTGTVVDYVGGQQDLAERRLRAIGDANARFAEDHLRLLRAVRFASRFGLRIDPGTESAIRQHAPRLARISPERIAEELRRMLPPATRDEAVRQLRDFGLLNVILRFLPEQPAPPIRADGLLSAITRMVPGDTIAFSLALAAISLDHRLAGRGHSDVGALALPAEVKRTCGALRQAMKISNDEERAVAGALSFGSLIGDHVPTVAKLKRFLATPYAADARLLMRALGVSAGGLEQRLSDLSQSDVAPTPLVTGDDLAQLGLSPGPAFKRILDAVYDAQLEDQIRTAEEARALAMSLA